MKTRLLQLGLFLALVGAARADYNPIALTPNSFNADVIVEKTAPAALNSYTTATVDGGANNTGNTLYERGFNGNQAYSGLPPHGSTFMDMSGTHTWIMPPDYTTNNSLFIGGAVYPGTTPYVVQSATGTLTLAAPQAFTSLSLLFTSGGNASNTIQVVVRHAGGGTELFTFGSPDWFNTALGPAFLPLGRVNLDNTQPNNLNSLTVSKVFSTYSTSITNSLNGDFFLADTVNPVTSIEFNYVSGSGRTFILAVGGSTDNYNYSPVVVSGFNAKMIVPAQATSSCDYFIATHNVSMDQGTNAGANTYYEVGLSNSLHGLPAHGSTFTTLVNHTFRMPATYAGNCAVFLGPYAANPPYNPDYRTGTLTLTTPAAYQKLSFLAGSGGGACVAGYVVNHADGSQDTGSISITDWFNAATGFSCQGRFVSETLTFASENVTSGSKIYAFDITLVNTGSTVTNIQLTYTSGGRAAIFALAGSTDGTLFTPVDFTGFDADPVVESSGWTTGQLRPTPHFAALRDAGLVTTVSMDGGTNNTGNTWYERGYYAAFPNSGLPHPGEIIASAADPTKFYQMPASYTANNAVFVDYAHTDADLGIQNPQTYSALSFLNATANNNVTNQAIMMYADGFRETNVFVAKDWFNNSPYAYQSVGRLSLDNRTFNNDPGRANPTNITATSTNPRLYEQGFALLHQSSVCTNIHLRFLGAVNPTTGRAVILAVSATAGAIPPIWVVQPGNITTNNGATVSLIGLASALVPITYQWMAGAAGSGIYTNLSNDSQFSGVTTTNLVINNALSTLNIADYVLVAANVAGSITSAPARLTITGPTLTLNPTSVATNDGATVVFKGGATAVQTITYQWKAGAVGSGVYTNLTDGGHYSGVTTPTLTITDAAYPDNVADYVLTMSDNLQSTTTTAATLSLISPLPNVFQASDPISIYGGTLNPPSPAAEVVSHVIDRNTQKYLNYGNGAAPFAGPAGFIATPGMDKTTVSVIRLYTANDTVGRDPADYLVEGSNDGGSTYTPIASGPLTLPAGRNVAGAVPNPYVHYNQEVRFANTTGYTTYRVSFSTLKDSTITMMQIAEVELLGVRTPEPPAFTRSLTPDVRVFAGASPNFSVAASGYPSPTYQWYSNSVPIPGVTGSSITLVNVGPANSGDSFYCTASNPSGTAKSGTAMLTVIAAPTSGYAVSVLADNPIAYLRLGEGPDDGMGDNGAIAYDNWGGHNGAYTNVILAQPGYPTTPADPDTATIFGSTIVDGYFVGAESDSCVGQIPGIDFAAPTNSSVAFAVEAWVRQSAMVGDQTYDAGLVSKGFGGGGEQFCLDTGATAGGTHGIRFFVRDASGAVVSANTGTNLLTDGQWHHIVGVCDQPNSNVTLYVDGRVSSKVLANPTAGLWASSFPVVIGSRPQNASTNNNLHFFGTIDETLVYNYALTANQVQSHYFAAGIAPTLSVSPTDTSAGEGQTVTLYSEGFGSPTLHYQWYQSTDGGATFTPMPGRTSANLTLANVPNPSPNPYAMYQVEVGNAYGTVLSAPVTLTVVVGPPTVITDISAGPVLVYAGRTFSYAPIIGGSAPMTFQWKKNGVNLSDDGRVTGSHAMTLNLNNAQGTDSGTYVLHVSNGQGAIDTTISTLYVEVTPDFNTNGLGWTTQYLNNPAAGVISNDKLALTTGVGGTASSAWYNYPLYIGAFQTWFTYQNTAGAGGADGLAFVAQNDPRGATALGGAGGALGYSGISPSVGLCLNIYANNTVGYSLKANGATPFTPFTPATPVALDSGNPINVVLTYLNGVLNIYFKDTVTLATYSANVAVSLPALVGSDTAYIGFTGGDGGTTSALSITNFAFVPLTALAVSQASPNSIVLSWRSAIGGYKLQSKSALDDNPNTWTDVADPGIETGGVVRVTVSPLTGDRFYRLVLTSSEP